MKIEFTHKAWFKMHYFVECCDSEISGLGKIREKDFDDGRGFEVYDVEIFEQTVSDAHSTLDVDTLGKFLDGKIRKGESVKPYRLWWHSHYNFNTFFSVTDTDTIELCKNMPYLLSIVSNHSGDFNSRLDFFKPFRITHEDIDIIGEVDGEDKKIKGFCIAEMKKKVKGYTYKKKRKIFGYGMPSLPKRTYKGGGYYEDGVFYPYNTDNTYEHNDDRHTNFKGDDCGIDGVLCSDCVYAKNRRKYGY